MDIDWLIGKSCSHVACIADGAFSFEFGDCGINIYCAWRIRQNGQIILAHLDHGQPYGLGTPIDVPTTAQKVLSEKRISFASLDEVTGDIHIELSDACTLEIFNDSSGFEAWSMTDPKGFVWFSGSGGEVSGYPRA